ncbi:hypothetical protein ACQP2E_05405 [Actinoplanes sp. CA-015351]|uniref:hypothetical protein n=1 Tax=Actinoplanes sp. CA-015351 TaxID=3239897 RepID=UPI003D965AF1
MTVGAGTGSASPEREAKPELDAEPEPDAELEAKPEAEPGAGLDADRDENPLDDRDEDRGVSPEASRADVRAGSPVDAPRDSSGAFFSAAFLAGTNGLGMNDSSSATTGTSDDPGAPAPNHPPSGASDCFASGIVAPGRR